MVYPPAIEALQTEERLPETSEIRQRKSINNTVEQDHRLINRQVKPSLGFDSFNTTRRTIRGYESITMTRRGQIKEIDRGDVIVQISLINHLLGMLLNGTMSDGVLVSLQSFRNATTELWA